MGLISGLGRSPGIGNGNPLQYSCPKIPMDRGALWSTVHGVAKRKHSWLRTHRHTHTDTHTLLKSWPTPGLRSWGSRWMPGPGTWLMVKESSKWQGSKTRGCFQDWRGLPWWLRQERIRLQRWRPTFNPWVGKIPWRRKWLPTPVYLPGEFHGQRSLVDYHRWGHKRVRHDWATNTLSGLGSHLKDLADGDESHEKYP